jgi:hypothetical protein
MNEGEIGGACDPYGTVENLMEKGPLEDLEVRGRKY